MSCTNPRHNTNRKCSREMSNHITGGNSETRRMLKLWVIMGSCCVDRDGPAGHMSRPWTALFLDMKKDSTLPSEQVLDDLAVTDWAAELPVPGVEQPRPVKRRATDKVPDVLGDRAADVPEHVHAEMRRLAEQGLIPTSSLAQRERSRFIKGCAYLVPDALKEAHQYGYVHPNLPPPLGLRWRGRNGTWALTMAGG